MENMSGDNKQYQRKWLEHMEQILWNDSPGRPHNNCVCLTLFPRN